MTEKFKDILIKCKDKTYYWGLLDDGTIYYEVSGFSKSGTVKLYETDQGIYVLARYNELDEIETYDDLLGIAFSWYSRYHDREPFTDIPPKWKEEVNVGNGYPYTLWIFSYDTISSNVEKYQEYKKTPEYLAIRASAIKEFKARLNMEGNAKMIDSNQKEIKTLYDKIEKLRNDIKIRIITE